MGLRGPDQICAPCLANSSVDMEAANNAVTLREQGPSAAKAEIFRELARWSRRKDLAEQETELYHSMHTDIASVLRGTESL